MTNTKTDYVVEQRVIVNADDLGISQKVNDAIFALIEEGRVTSATMIANGEAFEDAARRAKQYPRCSFGVHLNITQFKPLSQNIGLRNLTGQDGEMCSEWRNRFPRPSLFSAAFKEFSAQIERAHALVGKVSHVDSHHHVHTIPALFPVLAALVRKYRIEKVRISRNLFIPVESKSRALMAKKGVWNFALRQGLGLRTTDYFGDLSSVTSAAPQTPSTVEVMVHPGHDGYVDESKMLAREWWTGLSQRISFISYLEL